MRALKLSVTVKGVTYPVLERGGIFRAYLNGTMGWVSVWSDSYNALARRVSQARNGDQ